MLYCPLAFKRICTLCLISLYPFAISHAATDQETPLKLSTQPVPVIMNTGLCVPIPVITTPVITDGKIYLESDSADLGQKDVTTFTGSVVVKQNDQRLTADKAQYNKEKQDLLATGNVKLTTGSLAISGDTLQMNLKTNQGDVQNATYRDSSSRAQGKARSIVFKSESELEMRDATYSTCDSSSPDWELRATTINLNNATHQGRASNVVVRFKGIPFLYLPYLRFPIGDERLSGFLFPSFGSSTKNGNELVVPYYWNIHPQFDATITPHYMAKRGTQLRSEFRYLTDSTRGKFNIEYLPDDKITQTDRQAFSWQHIQKAVGGWSGGINYNYVSDPFYQNDFGGNLESASLSNLSRQADIRYDAKDWLFRGRVQAFQALTGSEQIKRLPQLNLNSRQSILPNKLNTSFQSEWTRFVHSTQAPIGDRLVLQPSVTLPFQNAAAYTTFVGSLHYTRYDLERISATENKTPTRTVPIFSMNSGVFFERDSTFNSKKYLHTLEPRLQYLYIPYREQSGLPTFDSATVTNNMNLLFSENRYSGADRINDANQITLGLTSRYINLNSGAEVLTASIGQIYQFEDSQVTLGSAPARTKSWSDLQLDLTFQPVPSLKINGSLIRNQQTRELDKRNIRLQYKTSAEHIINVSYRFERDTLETREISGIWRINPRWSVLARQHQDLLQNRELETVYGIQYDSCCWGLRLVKRRYYSGAFPNEPGGDPSNPYNETLFLELELKGLSSFGQKKQIDSLLRRGILGYSQ